MSVTLCCFHSTYFTSLKGRVEKLHKDVILHRRCFGELQCSDSGSKMHSRRGKLIWLKVANIHWLGARNLINSFFFLCVSLVFKATTALCCAAHSKAWFTCWKNVSNVVWNKWRSGYGLNLRGAYLSPQSNFTFKNKWQRFNYEYSNSPSLTHNTS